MSHPSGLSDHSNLTVRPPRRRPNANSQLEDRQPTSSSSHPKKSTQPSIPSKRQAHTRCDPDKATPAWEVYRDPSEDSMPGYRVQKVTENASASVAASHHSYTPGPAAQSKDRPSDSRILYAPDHASRVVGERMLRTFDQVLAEEHERKAIAFFNGQDADANATRLKDDVIAKLQARYEELTLAETREKMSARGDAEDDHQGNGGADGGRKKRKKKSKKGGKKKEEKMEETEEVMVVEEGIYDQNANVDLWLDDTATASSVPIPASTSNTTRAMPAPVPASTVTGLGMGVVGLSFAERDRARKRAKLMKRNQSGPLRGRAGYDYAHVGDSGVALAEMVAEGSETVPERKTAALETHIDTVDDTGNNSPIPVSAAPEDSITARVPGISAANVDMGDMPDSITLLNTTDREGRLLSTESTDY